MTLARAALRQARLARVPQYGNVSLTQARPLPPMLFAAGHTAVTRRALWSSHSPPVAKVGSGSSSASSSSSSSVARWTTVMMAAGSVALVLGLMQDRSVYMEEARSGKSSAGQKKDNKAKKSGDGESKGVNDKLQRQEEGRRDAQSSNESDKAENTKKEERDETDGKGAEVDEASSLDMDDLSDEASQQSAFDPETNTINWDCPCLGGMAHGPCGEQFKEAFSCFVFSEADPKGVDCIENFKAMQDCFRKYPEHYKDELEDDEDGEVGEASHEASSEKSGSAEGTAKRGATQAGADDEEDDEGVREWRAEMAKENSTQ